MPACICSVPCRSLVFLHSSHLSFRLLFSFPQWSPAQTIRTVLLSLQLLLCTPNPDDPQDGVVAQMYRRSLAEFEAEARKWTKMYALPANAPNRVASEPPFPFPDALGHLTEMGFSAEDAKRVLVATKGDVNEAVAQLTN